MKIDKIKLIVGLGNPGSNYAATRHNAGWWVIQALADKLGGSWKSNKSFTATLSSVEINGNSIKLLMPDNYMNNSGISVASYVKFYNIPLDQILVIHDEVGIAVAELKLKKGGGHNGHNGLKDIDARIGKDYWRLRCGISHPGDKDLMVGYVLGKPPAGEQQLYQTMVDFAVKSLTQSQELEPLLAEYNKDLKSKSK